MELPNLVDVTWSNVAASATLILVTLALRAFLTRILIRYMSGTETRRRWIVNLRNVALIVLVAGLAAIWADALRTFLVAAAAVGVAVVLATKEFILCINGSILRATSNAYSVGDRVQFGGHRGDVIDLNLFSTTILEVGPGSTSHLRTGRKVVIPHSKLLDSPVVNESFMQRFVLHVFSVPLKLSADWQKAEQALLSATAAECKPYLAAARESMERLESGHGLEGIPVEPRVLLQLPEAGKITFLVRFPAPIGRQGRLEQAILRRFFEEHDFGDSSAQEKPVNGSRGETVDA